MRQIKFRVRNINTGKIVGYECLFPTDVKNSNFEWVSSGNNNDWQPGIILGSRLQREQFALLDKNGKEIYEGDIVKTMDGVHTVIYGNMKPASFKIGFYLEHKRYGRWVGIGDIEIIGNIYENKELLK